MSLHARFLRAAELFPNRSALEVDGSPVTYADLRSRAEAIAASLERRSAEEPPLTAVFAYRSETAFAGILAALIRGHAYVPLNRTFPPDRTRVMLERAGCRSVIVDAASAGQLEEIVGNRSEQLVIVAPDLDEVTDLRRRMPQHTFLGARDLEGVGGFEAVEVDPDSMAYLLFTSGSTGVPKGVMVSHANVSHFLDVMTERYEVNEADRLSQTFDMTFDLSVFDMFVAWSSGACVCCVPQSEVIKPGKFIRDAELTIWFSVPSTGIFMKRLGMLKPDRYPSLRWSLFCGEPLPADIAEAWAAAAPNSIVENLYGPTELTIACMLYRWDPVRGPNESHHGIVPIGAPYPGMATRVVDGELREVEPGAEGELMLCGPQVALGYWNDPEKTEAVFVTPEGAQALHYRTGDLVRRPIAGAPMTYVGRVDHQVKVNGHRVELGEVEATLRELTGVQAVVAIGWPRTAAGAAGVTAFVGDTSIDVQAIRSQAAARLPDYMVPREIRAVDAIPLNANGKFDRNALVSILETG